MLYADPVPLPARQVVRVILDDAGIRRSIMRIAHEILERNESEESLYLVAIPNGGVPLARLLVANLKQIGGRDIPLGILDTTLYRDDLHPNKILWILEPRNYHDR